MKVLLILTIIAAARAGFLPPNLPFRFTYQNEQQSPLGSSNTNINGGIVSTTAAPIELNNALVSSTPSPLGFQNEFISNGNAYETIVSSTPQPNIYSSTVNQDSEYVSSTPAPVLPNQNFNSFFVPNIQTYPRFYPGNPQLINNDANSNSFVQQIPQRLGDYTSVTIESTTSGGSLNDAFGVSEDVIESQKPEKNIYFFVAPQEPEPIRPKIHFQESKKKVNVVFIKAPAAPSLGTIEITPPEQESPEKTVVYVLVKKPEERQNIIVKQAPAVKPQKPEVVFIKYRDEEEAQEHINKVQAQHDAYIKNQQIGQDILRSGELFNERQSLPIPNPEYIPLINPRFGTTTESTLSAIENEGNDVTQGPLQYNNYRFNNVPLAYTTTTVSPSQFNPIEIQQQQQQYVPEYISNGALLQQQVISTSTESPINNGVSETKPFSNLGFNYVPLTYANQRPQVSINEISNNENIDNFITIGNRQQSSEIIEPTPSPFKRWSSISPRVSSNQSPISASPTARPSISNYHLFFKKQ